MTRATALLLALLAGATAQAAVVVTVTDASNRPVDQVVVIVEPVGGDRGAAVPRGTGLRAVIDQQSLQFVPEISVVRTGTAIEFPNSDQVRHQVYSFSGAKTFQLALYAGRGHAPVIFDRNGLVTLGCNIHDSMLGYIIVTDSPWYGRTGSDGTLRLRELAPGEYRLTLWHPLIDETGPQLQQQLNVTEGAGPRAGFRLTRPLRPPLHHHGADKKWDDY